MTMSSATLHLPAPAKLNLFLHILNRRADGYHNLQTVFQLVDWCDYLTFTPREDAAIRIHANIALPENNTIYRAAQALQQREARQWGVDIHLQKNIPIGAGLGGGSSDAATTLIALNRLWHLQLDLQTLSELGLSIGADVPVFVQGQSAWAEGVGEQLTPITLPETWFVIVRPACSVSTAKIFSALELTSYQTPCTISDFNEGKTRNVLESVVRSLYPEVDAAFHHLPADKTWQLTGTGSCLFTACEEETEAQALCDAIGAAFQAQPVKGQNQSTLHQAVGLF